MDTDKYKFTLSNFVPTTWAILKADGKVILTIPAIFWLGIGLVVTGLLIVSVGVYLILLTTRGI